MENLFDLSSKYAIVTGAGRDLGRSIAIGLADVGASVAVTDIIDTKSTIEEIHKIEKHGFSLKVVVTRKSDIDSMVQEILKSFPRIDILVNNAGILKIGQVETFREDEWVKGSLVGKHATEFTSLNTQHCRQEITIISTMLTLFHHGCILVGLLYTVEEQSVLTEIFGV